jgi:hypothetical protein
MKGGQDKESAEPANEEKARRQEIAKYLDSQVKLQATKYVRYLNSIIVRELEELNIQYDDIVDTCLLEAALNAAKDLNKMALYHPINGVEPLKLLGYLCFWVRKIKPVIGAKQGGEPYRAVNELLSIHMAAILCVRYAKKHPGDVPNSDASAVERRARSFMKDQRRVDYLVHCMRYRTFGPHHYVMILQNIVYGF